jgi:hypothetical protein
MANAWSNSAERRLREARWGIDLGGDSKDI